MQLNRILKILILGGFILAAAGCAFLFYPPTGDIITKTVVVDFLAEGTLPSGDTYLGLFNEMNELIVMQKATEAGKYSFTEVPLQHPDASYRKTKVAFFIDANKNGKYDSSNLEESQSFAVTRVLDMEYYAAKTDTTINASAVVYKMAGTVDFAGASMGTDPAKRYLYFKNDKDSVGKVIKVENNGSFAFYEGTRNDGSKSELWAFYDENDDGVKTDIYDKVAFIGLYGTTNGIADLNIDLIRLYGSIDRSGVDGNIYNFTDGAINRAVIRVENTTYYRTYYQKPKSNGDFTIFSVKGQTIDPILFHVSSSITDYPTQYQNFLLFPVRLAGPLAFNETEDYKELQGADGAGDPITLHKVHIQIENTTGVDTGNKPIVLRTKRNWYYWDQILIINENNFASIPNADSIDLFFYFRDFDTASESSDSVVGQFILTFQVYLDINGNLLLDADESLATGGFADQSAIKAESNFTGNKFIL